MKQVIEIKGNYGKCYFCDLFDKDYGLPTFEKKQWDLCLTDPPYNIGKGIINRAAKARKRTIEYYPDNMSEEEYHQFSQEWFELADQKAERIVFTPGSMNFRWWINNYSGLDFIIHYNRGRGAEQLNAKLSLHEPILTWNVNKNTGKFMFSVYAIHSDVKETLPISHPCPKNSRLWRKIIQDLKPISVIDPFIGSGTTAEICEEYGIPWIGFEKSLKYVKNVRSKIKRGQNNFRKNYQNKQQNITSFFK